MKSKEGEGFVSGTFTWRIDNFSKLNNIKHYSEVFVIGGLKWRILIHPKGNYVNLVKQFSMYLGVADASTWPSGWTRYANFSLTLVNQLDSKKSITKPTKGSLRQVFKENKSDWGFTSFIPFSDLYACSAGYLVNDICIVQAKVDVPIKIEDDGPDISATMESSNMNSVQAPGSSPASKTPCSELALPLQDSPGSEQVCSMITDDSPAEPSLVNKLGQGPATPTGELINFRGLGLVEKAFVPLLEEVCLRHPSLIEFQKKKSQLIAECAFTALGRLLHFLKTTKVKDMTLDACEQLQLFWDELETFRFDLAWLEPHVESAFGMKKFVQRAARKKRLREDVEVLEDEIKRRSEGVDALENEIRRRRTTVAVAEIELHLAKRDLAMVEEDFNKIDMDSELGYGRP